MKSDSLLTLDLLRSGDIGGIISLNIEADLEAETRKIYGRALSGLDKFAFWHNSAEAPYRPDHGLWLPQRRAIAFAHAYLSSARASGPGTDLNDDTAYEAALIKMPTGTGKTGVIASIACASPLISRTLVITPRVALVRQMKLDLSFRFWKKLDAVYFGGELHESFSQEEIRAKQEEILSGAIAPVRVLEAHQYQNIYDEQGCGRQILVSTFNALHRVLRLEPPAHRSFYGHEPPPIAKSIRRLGEELDEELDPKIEEQHIEEFQEALHSVDLVIVDEGHYEPAFSWAQAVRELEKPTLIFTATPYRNDYKYFKIKGNYVFNLPWKEAVEERLIRGVKIASSVGAQSGVARHGRQRLAKSSQSRRRYTERNFVAEFTKTLEALPRSKKAIVHAGTYETLKRLQRAFYEKGVAAVVIHDRFIGKEKQCPDLKDTPGEQELCSLRFQHVAQTEGHSGAQASRVWMHQYKLLEGIDDSTFIEVWLYDGFGTARQLVQQIGRAIRLPNATGRAPQVATVRGSSKVLDIYSGAPTVAEQTRIRWQDYLEFEEYAARNPKLAFIAETQLVATIKRTAPAVQYIAGEFRRGHILDDNPPMTAFQLPRRGIACRVNGITDHMANAITDDFLDNLQKRSKEAMNIEERFDIRIVASAAERVFRDVRLIRYLAWSNSPLLASHHIPEWRLGVMAIVRAGRYIFLLDTEGICVDTARLDLLSPEPVELKRLFPKSTAGSQSRRTQTRIVETSAKGLDISELGLRSISVRKHALEEGYFDLAEASQVPSWVRGFGQLGESSARRRLSLAHSSVADATNKYLRVSDYVNWVRLIANTMANDTVEPHGYFQRFAKEVLALDNQLGAPQSVLLDLWDIVDVAAETLEERRWDAEVVSEILKYDTCCDVKPVEDGKGNTRYVFYFGTGDNLYPVELTYVYRNTIPPYGRYTIQSAELNAAVVNSDLEQEDVEDELEPRTFGQKLGTSLTRLINQEQAFSIIPQRQGVVYSHSHFYMPEVDESVLSILEPCRELGVVVSEKGDTRLDDPLKWNSGTLFGVLYGWVAGVARSSEFARDIKACDIVINDDRTDEIADFFCIDSRSKRVFVVHAKAEDGKAGASARHLQDVTRQAQASLAFASTSRRPFELPERWKEAWSVTLRDAGGAEITKPRVIARAGLSPAKAHKRLMECLADPSYSKEVVMLTSGLLSASAAKAAYLNAGNRDRQFVYFLASVRSSFDRAGVRFRIVGNT